MKNTRAILGGSIPNLLNTQKTTKERRKSERKVTPQKGQANLFNPRSFQAQPKKPQETSAAPRDFAKKKSKESKEGLHTWKEIKRTK